MTAKFPSRKLLSEDLKHRSWMIVLMAAGALALLPFALQLELSAREYEAVSYGFAEYTGGVYGEKLSAAAHILGGGNALILFACLTAAVISAVTGFGYLHSRRQVDFYHSLPVRRERLFAVRYLSGFLMVIVPYLLCLAAAVFGVGGSHGVLCRELVLAAAEGAGFFILMFLVFYTLSVLAVLLTGRILTGLLLTGFFFLYGILCKGMLQGMMSYYFRTFCETSWQGTPGNLLSPVSLGLEISSRIRAGDTVPAGLWIILAAAAAALLILCLAVCRKRPSEAAGNAFCCRWLEPFLKVAVIIPASLWIGVLLQWLGYLANPVMADAAVLLSALALTGVFEFICSQDLKNVWRHRISGIISLAGTLVILLAFQKDWFGYDRWQPAEDRVEAMSFHAWEGNDVFMENTWYIPEQEKSVLEGGFTENFDPIYQLARTGIEYLTETPEEENLISVTVQYRLKSGVSACRSYEVPEDSADGVLEKLSEDSDFRKKNYPAYGRNLKNVTEIFFSDWNNLKDISESVALSPSDREKLLTRFQEDSSSFSYMELKNMAPAGMLRLYCDARRDSEDGYGGTEIGYYVYPEFVRTLDYLEQKGIRLLKEPDTSEIISVQLDYLTDVTLPDTKDVAASAVSQVYLFYTQDSIRALFGQLVRARMSDYLANGEYASLQIMYSDGTYSSVDYRIRDREAFRKFLEENGSELLQ